MKPKPVSLDDFAQSHGLELEVEWRETFSDFMARFDGVEIKDRCVLISEYGYGATPLQAKRHYAAAISGKILVENAMGPHRREIIAPRLAVPPQARPKKKRRKARK